MQNNTYISYTHALLILSSRAYLYYYLIFNISFYPNVQARHHIQIHILFFQLLTRSFLCLL
jgi:hypothetical protein